MSSHFNWKSLAFYGAAIGFVVALFSVTTAYGEAHIQAPQDIDGRYVIDQQNLPGCLGNQPLALDIKQSGVYLTGALLPANADEKLTKSIEQHPPLTGDWNNQQLSLAGSLSHIPNCQASILLDGTIEQDNVKGTIRLNASSPPTTFTARRDEKPPATAQTH